MKHWRKIRKGAELGRQTSAEQHGHGKCVAFLPALRVAYQGGDCTHQRCGPEILDKQGARHQLHDWTGCEQGCEKKRQFRRKQPSGKAVYQSGNRQKHAEIEQASRSFTSKHVGRRVSPVAGHRNHGPGGVPGVERPSMMRVDGGRNRQVHRQTVGAHFRPKDHEQMHQKDEAEQARRAEALLPHAVHPLQPLVHVPGGG